MQMMENVSLALAGLKSNLMRSLLTMLGIIIGIASVIAIMTVGNSIKVMVNTMMQDLGANNLTVGVSEKSTSSDDDDDSGFSFDSNSRRAMSTDDYITDEMLDKYLETYGDNILYTLKNDSVGSGTAKDGSKYAYVTVQGANKDSMENSDLDMLAGRDFLDRDYEDAMKVCIVSDYFVDNMFKGDKQAAMGQPISVSMNGNNYTYYIVGVYKYDASMNFSFASKENTQTTLYIPFETAKKQTHSDDGYSNLTLVTTVGTDNTEFAKTTANFFNMYYYANNADYEVTVFSMESMMDTINTMLSSISLALSIIAGISLVVGGIGVMNIMLVSITERTKEIGTRKALGATNASIRMQFITESIVLCVIGGIIGIILGIVLGTIAMKVMGYESAVSLSSIIIAVLFSMGIGVFFGYYPANKAAQLNPIDALRYE